MSDAKLTIAIGGKLDASLTSAVNSAEGMLDRLNGGSGKSGISKVFSGIGQTIANVGKASMASLAGITSGMIAAGTASVNTGMDFESAMSDLAGTAGITKSSEAFAKYQDAAREVGATTNKTATEAAEALKYMALAGWDVNDSTAALSDMVKLSSASGTDLARTSDLVTDSMGALNLTMEDYGGYMDMVARADSAANYSSAQFMETMIGSGGSARMLGVDVTELATAAGILANNGTKGSEAGTKLNSMFARMAGNSKPVQDALAKLDTTITDSSGNFLSFEGMLGNVKTSLAGIADESERAQIMKDLFGTHNLSEAQYLLDSIGEGGAWDGLQTNLENAKAGVDEFGNAADTLNDRYQTATDNLQGDLDILKSTISDFGIEIYDSLVGGEGTGIRGAVQEATTIVNDLKEAFKVDGLDGLAKGIGEAIGDVSDTIGEKGATAITDAGDFATQLVNAIGGEGADVGGAAAKIITSIGTSFAKYTDDFVITGGQLVQGLMDGVVAEGTAEQWASGLGTMVTNIGTWFSENGAQLGETAGVLVTQLAQGLADHSGDIISGGIAIVGGIAKGILTGLPVLVSNLPNILKSIVGGIKDSIPDFLSVGAELGEALMEGLGQIATEWEIGGLRGAEDDMQYLADNAEAMNATMTELWANTDTSNMTSATQAMVENLLSGKTSVEEFSATLESMRGYGLPEDIRNMDAALSAYTDLAGTAREQLEATQQEAQAAAEATASATEATAESSAQSIEQLSDFVMSQFETAQAEADAAGSAMQEALAIDTSQMSTDALSAIIESIDTGNIDQITAQFETAMNSLTTSANTASTSVQNSLSTMGTNSLTSVSTSLISMVTAMSTSFISMIDMASTTSTSIYDSFAGIDLGSVASNMMNGLIAGIQEGGASAISEAQRIASEIAATMAGALKISSPSKVTEEIGNFTGQGLVVGMQGAESDIYSAAADMADAAQQGTASNVLRTFAGGGPYATAPQMGAAQAGGGQVVFSPQITITGNASEADVRSALSWSIEQFRQMYRQMQAEDKRTAFA